MINSNIANRALSIRKHLQLSQRAMADQLHISLTGWQQIENGKNTPSGQTLKKLAELGFSVDWLLIGTGAMHANDDNAPAAAQDINAPVQDAQHAEAFDDFVLIPYFGDSLFNSSNKANCPRNSDAILNHEAFRKEWIRDLGLDPSRTEILTAVGDSMEPSISNGNVLLVDRSFERAAEDGVYVLNVNNNLFVKRLHTRMDGSVIVRSDNPAYPEDTFSAEAAGSLKIIGRVRWIGNGKTI